MTKIVTLDFFKTAAELSIPGIQFLPVAKNTVPVARQEWTRSYKYPAGVIAVGHFGNRFAGLLTPLSNALSKTFYGVKNFIYYDIMVAASERKARHHLGLNNQTIADYKGSLIAQRGALETQLSLQWHQSNPACTGHGAQAQVFVKGKPEYANLSREQLLAKIDSVNADLSRVYATEDKSFGENLLLKKIKAGIHQLFSSKQVA